MVSRTRLQYGEASYSYKIKGLAGRGASWRTELESRMRKGPRLRAYFPSSPFAKIVSIYQPNTSTPTARRTARAAVLLRTLGGSSLRVRVKGLGSGNLKSAGTCTFGVDKVGIVLVRRSSKKPAIRSSVGRETTNDRSGMMKA
jgi:hypothetical protein